MAGEALLGAAFGMLIDRLASPKLINFFRGRKHDERLLKKLKLKLLGLNKVLNDAENKQINDRAVKEWLDELKGAVYDAEDLVDEIATEALRCKVEAEYQSGPNQVQSLISSFTKLFDNEIESKLERMIEILEDFTEEKDVLGLKEVAGRNWSQTRLPTTSLVDESCVYGRENDKEKLMKLLLSDGESSYKVDVIPIVGMGGVGKTTLAQLLYNDGRLDGHFVKKAWVCVSDVFDVSRVTLAIVEAITEKTLRFENCFFLPPLGQMPSLKELTIESMPGITSLGREFYGEGGSLSKPFQSLETLRFAEMSGWVDWCILDAGEFSQLKKLKLIQCPKLIGHLPTKLPSLVGLKIQDCAELVASLPNTTSLRRLELYGCQGMQLQWQGVSSIEYLSISDFASLEEFPSELVTLTNLKSLIVGNCPRLYVPLSDEMSHRNMFLEWLDLYGCESLKSIPLGLFPKLRSLQITGCTNFETLILEGCKNMSSLLVQRCEKLKALPEQMHTLLPSLERLYLYDCPEIESFPGEGLPSKLGLLRINNCKKLVGGRRDWGLQTLPSLTGIYLGGESEDVLESFPEEGLLPSTLTDLGIKGMRNLKSLNGRGLQPLGSLERMEIHNCPQLQSFSVEGLPTSLLELEVRGCPLLKPRCRRKEGEDWPKISHIPLILVDDEPISE